MNKPLSDKVNSLPRVPGVYLFKNEKDKIIYVGKAKNLKHRVSSYFQKNLPIGTKTASLVSKIYDIDIVKTASELEALVLEAELIKAHYPKYNVALKDDKSYLYIVIRKDPLIENHKKLNIPKVITARKSDLQENDFTFGPYPSSNDARSVIRSLRKVFPYRDCAQTKFFRYRSLNRPCLFGQIGLCTAPCQKDADLSVYKSSIRKIIKFLSGDASKLIASYEKRMKKASKEEKYEEAATHRDYLRKLHYVRESYKSANQYIENPNLIEDIAMDALEELKKNIELVNKRPKRIECYDISTISGKDAVGSMVVAVDGQLDKSEYRRFKIKTISTPNDYLMMKEVLERRIRRSTSDKSGKWSLPDLLVVDGGKGQVSVVAKILEELNVKIPLVGLAKRLETIVYIKGDHFVEVSLSRSNEGLKLLINLRDESHRFAQNYHHKLRLKTIRE